MNKKVSVDSTQVSADGIPAPQQVSSASARPPAAAGSAARWPVGLALLLGLALGAAGAGLWFDDQASRQHGADRQKLELALDESRAGLAQAHAQADALQGQLMVEEATRKGLEVSLQAAQAELGQVSDKLAFFDQLLPPGPAGSIGIRALDIEQHGPTLQYRVLLMRNGADDKPFKGLMQFVVRGNRQGKAVKMTLQPAQAPAGDVPPGANASEDALQLSFDQFQRAGGFLSLPEGFTPQTVTLNVLEGSAVRVSRTVNLSAAD
ncbi:MAG: DUF6776 family protein [Pollutimonas bauzanensis]